MNLLLNECNYGKIQLNQCVDWWNWSTQIQPREHHGITVWASTWACVKFVMHPWLNTPTNRSGLRDAVAPVRPASISSDASSNRLICASSAFATQHWCQPWLLPWDLIGCVSNGYLALRSASVMRWRGVLIFFVLSHVYQPIALTVTRVVWYWCYKTVHLCACVAIFLVKW